MSSAVNQQLVKQESQMGVVFKCLNDEVICITDKKIISKLPVPSKALSQMYPKWLEKGEHYDASFTVPFEKPIVKFFLNTVGRYQSPKTRSSLPNIQKHFPETMDLTLDAVKKLLQMACIFEAQDMADAMGFVLSERVKRMDINSAINILGLNDNDVPVIYPSTSSSANNQ